MFYTFDDVDGEPGMLLLLMMIEQTRNLTSSK